MVGYLGLGREQAGNYHVVFYCSALGLKLTLSLFWAARAPTSDSGLGLPFH